jgi:4-hydroxy-3-polyprenylbenzoate decarboxylase
MQIKGLVWAGTATDRYAETVAFFRDVLGLSPFHASDSLTVLRLPSGDWMEVFGPGLAHFDEFSTGGVVVEFLVDDLAAARSELEGRAWSSCTRTTTGGISRGRTSAVRTGTSTGSPAAPTARPSEVEGASGQGRAMTAPRSEPPVVVAMTGATGAIYGIRLLEALAGRDVETHLVISRWADRTIVAETAWKPDDVRRLADHVWGEDELDAPIAHGETDTRGMIVAPCSMKSLAAIANGITENLIHRAAEVTMKENRRLLLLVREAPLSVIHLENMLRVAKAGAIVMPPVPAFYARPKSLDEMVDHTVGRMMDHFAVDHELVRRWGERRRVAWTPRIEPGGGAAG